MLPTRAAGLARLAAFTPLMGRAYAEGRNFDPGPGKPAHVSVLSPYIRHRLITEQEVVTAAIAAHSAEMADKFIQEVFWRSYWKGWLAQRPTVWAEYRMRVADALQNPPEGYAAAIAGRTGIACFDAWVTELIETGNLHNHARMWFASIWIFTLRLPWVLGADFFLRHLLDGDAASNTLSWRWVAGLHTKGKHYVARAENIARHTGGRFAPHGALNEAPTPLQEPDPPAPHPIPTLPAPRSILVCRLSLWRLLICQIYWRVRLWLWPKCRRVGWRMPCALMHLCLCVALGMRRAGPWLDGASSPSRSTSRAYVPN